MSEQFTKTSRYYLQQNNQGPNFFWLFTNRRFNYDPRAAENTTGSEKIISSRKHIFTELELDPARAVFPRQVHGSHVFTICSSSSEKEPSGTDAVITGIKRVPLCVLTADCLPIVFFDPVRSAIGIAHAGWRGTAKRIAAEVIKKMCAELDCVPGRIKVGFGPAIRSCCYEVGQELKQIFPAGVRTRDGRFFFDLAAENIHQLKAEGVNPGNILDSGICTSCKNDEFFSFRRGDEKKRMLTMIWIS